MATTEVKIATEGIRAAAKSKERVPPPTVVIIFGASGDLTKRKLLPALFHLEQGEMLPAEFGILGVARRDLAVTFADDMRAGIVEFGGVQVDDPKLSSFIRKVTYHQMNFDDDAGYERLKEHLAAYDSKYGVRCNRLFYLAVGPEYFSEILSSLGRHGMTQSRDIQVRVIIEKPFGQDLESARILNAEVNQVLDEDQIFRIDHYLGKETVQNILVFRFANGIFEPIWNRNYIDHIQITAAESIGIEGRGPFYEKAGALRDVMQNHMMELLSFVCMEPPVSFEADAVRFEKVKVWRAVQPIRMEDAVRGQYGPGEINGSRTNGYRQEDRVDPNSRTETFAALKLGIENWRWAGVPIYLRAGKRLARRQTEITIQFKQPPMLLFNSNTSGPCAEIQPNLITMRIQPNEGISLRFGAKVPSPDMTVCPVDMNFQYSTAFGTNSANGYERLLLDAMLGDATLFAHRDGVEATWALMTPLLQAWAHSAPPDFPNYSSGSWGPRCAEELIEREGRRWNSM